MAHAASTALPPRWKIIAPACAPSGLPVIATQCWPCSTGLCGLSARALPTAQTRAIADAVAAAIAPAIAGVRRAERNNTVGDGIADLRWGPTLSQPRSANTRAAIDRRVGRPARIARRGRGSVASPGCRAPSSTYAAGGDGQPALCSVPARRDTDEREDAGAQEVLRG